MKPDNDQLRRFTAFVVERQSIWYRRHVVHAPKPWTQDAILQSYRFCNVFRELDTVTQWTEHHIRTPYKNHPHLWLMLCAARQINWPDTLLELMGTKGAFFNSPEWRAAVMRGVMLDRKNRGDKVYTGAYMISGQRSNPDRTKADKPHITANLTLLPLWKERRTIGAALRQQCDTLQAAYDLFSVYNGFGSFMTAQVVADLKHTHYLQHAKDWWTWCALGPGSTRGLNRLYARRRDSATPHKGRFKPLNLRWSAEEAMTMIAPIQLAAIDALRKASVKLDGFLPYRPLCAQDTQNCLCEFDKYERARLNEGKPRTLYNGRG